MGDMFGGKLTAGIFSIVALFIGIIMAGIMAGPFGVLIAYFDDSGEFVTGNNRGTKFQRVYTPITGRTAPGATQINLDTNRAGGSGFELAKGDSGDKGVIAVSIPSGATVPALGIALYNEQGQAVGSADNGAGTPAVCTAALCYLAFSRGDARSIDWKSPPPAFTTLAFLNSILVTLLGLVAVIGLILKTKNAYEAFKTGGMGGDLGKTVMTEVSTFVLGIVGVYFGPPLLNILADTASIYTVGQFDFSFVGSILKIVFSVIPTMVIIGIMGLVSGLPGGTVAQSAMNRARGGVGNIRNRRRVAY